MHMEVRLESQLDLWEDEAKTPEERELRSIACEILRGVSYLCEEPFNGCVPITLSSSHTAVLTLDPASDLPILSPIREVGGGAGLEELDNVMLLAATDPEVARSIGRIETGSAYRLTRLLHDYQLLEATHQASHLGTG